MGPNDQWLFREGDLILGPVPSQQIIDKLYAGELQGHSEVQLMGSGVFRKIVDFPEFKVHVAKAEAKQRVDAHAQEHHASQKKNLQRALAIGAGVLVAVGIIVGVIGNSLAKRSLDGKSAEELAWGDITIDAPTVSRAQRNADDELVEYTGTGRKPPPRAPVGNAPTLPANPGTPKPKMGTADSDGMAMGEVDQDAINSVIAKFKPTLIPCIKEVAKPGMPPTQIPIQFTVNESGKVSKVWVDNPDFKSGPLPECLMRELAKWPFKAQGTSASVGFAFNIGKKG